MFGAAPETRGSIAAVVDTYRERRAANEHFIDTVRRVGLDPFKVSANGARRSTAAAHAA